MLYFLAPKIQKVAMPSLKHVEIYCALMRVCTTESSTRLLLRNSEYRFLPLSIYELPVIREFIWWTHVRDGDYTST